MYIGGGNLCVFVGIQNDYLLLENFDLDVCKY